MLNNAERHRLLRVIQHCCTFGLVPAQVDLLNWELLPHGNKYRIWKCRIGFFLFVLHVMYKLGSLATACVLRPSPPLYQMIIHGVLAIAAAVYIYWYLLLHVQYPDVFRVYLKMTLTGNIGETSSVDDQEEKSWSRRLREYTLRDLYVLSMPYMVLATVVAIIIAYIFYQPNLLLYAALPTKYQTWYIFGILLLEELRYLVICISIAIPVFTLQVISFDLVNSQLKRLMNSLERTAHMRNLQHVYKSLRHLQLYVGIVNLINRFVIWTWKVLCITNCITTGYAAIAHFGDYPVFGIMYYGILLDCSFIYTFYGQAFQIPALFKKTTQRALLHAHDKRRPQASKILKRKIMSIPRVGIKVGEFHMMERECTLIFMHYVLNNIVTLLVANRVG